MRIIALADVSDALTSRRVYKAAFAHDIARSMIMSEIGTQFDPQIANAFAKNEERFAAIRDRFNDNQRSEAAA